MRVSGVPVKHRHAPPLFLTTAALAVAKAAIVLAPLAVASALVVACGGAPGTGPATIDVAPVGPAGGMVRVDPEALALEPAPRPGSARRFLRLVQADSPALTARVAIDVPAAWGYRVRDAGGRALRPCQVSPSSPSELFVTARPACEEAACAEHEKLAGDLSRAGLLVPGEVASSTSEALRPLVHVTRLTGGVGLRRFSAFRVVHVDAQSLVPVACEAFLFADEIAWQAVYEQACSTIHIAPADWQEGPEDLAPAPDGKARSTTEESIAQSAVGYLSALSARDARTADLFLLTAQECVASGGAPDICENGADERRAELGRGLSSVPTTFVPGTADVRYPSSLGGLVIATVKRRGDPCGPGYDVTLARGEKRYGVISPEPAPDPRLPVSSR